MDRRTFVSSLAAFDHTQPRIQPVARGTRRSGARVFRRLLCNKYKVGALSLAVGPERIIIRRLAALQQACRSSLSSPLSPNRAHILASRDITWTPGRCRRRAASEFICALTSHGSNSEVATVAADSWAQLLQPSCGRATELSHSVVLRPQYPLSRL
jgi:hypothetical protein